MNKRLSYLLWAVLLGVGFFAGVAWKDKDAKETSNNDDSVLIAATKDPQTNTQRVATPRGDLNDSELATIELFEKAAPSVCFITTSNLRRDFFSMDITEIPRGTGSGFVWDKTGHVVTNFHVIQGANRLQVTLANQSSWEATLVGSAPEKDLAVLKIEAPVEQLVPIPVGESENLRVGQAVYAIGNPFGLDQTLTTGIVSALGREIESVAGIPIRGVIQTDAAINPGNSGGPLLDSSGRLIGVNTAIYSPSGASAGIGFSIPVQVVSWVVPELIVYKEIKRPTLGVELALPRIADRLGLEGALVINVVEGSAADKAGIRPTMRNRSGGIELGDIITGLNGEPIQSNNDLILALEKFQPGDEVDIEIKRNDQLESLKLILDPSR